MNKRFLISVVVVFVMLMAIGFVVHGLLLAPDYAQLTSIYRSPDDQMKYFPFMLPAHLFMAVAFVWIYRSRVKEDKPPTVQGIRYGLAIASMTIIPKFLIYYSIQPIPGALVCKQISFDTLGVVLMGIVVARLNK